MTETEPRFKAGDNVVVREILNNNGAVLFTAFTVLEVAPSGHILATKDDPSGWSDDSDDHRRDVRIFRPNGTYVGDYDGPLAACLHHLDDAMRDALRRQELERLAREWGWQAERLTLAELERVDAIFVKAVNRAEDRKATERAAR